jgi:hypothetical protein
MKNLILIFALLFSLQVNAVQGTGVVGSITTNPAANAVLVTTSGLTSGSASANYTVTIWWSCSILATYQYQVLNVSSSVVASVNLYCPAMTTSSIGVSNISFSIPNGFTLRVINVNSFTGTGQASIFYAKETEN